MNASPVLPLHFHWTAQELADAVPQRLSQLPLFDAAADTRNACNDARARPRPAVGYLPRPALTPAFRIH
ncbi:hypothetical protein [Thermomonas alba]|uniref:hypothetical protein n=1 Tax=Thermomonas alba TaxID=2888525 RepID=UPI001F0457B4|nr:hypothetical protein [Thermomonas alba]